VTGKGRTFKLPSDSSTIPSDVAEEVAFHIEEKARQLIARGMGEEEAWREARRRFGDVEKVTAAMRKERRMVSRATRLHAAWQDLGQALRALKRSPGFTAITILALALGIGANAALFGVVDHLLLRGPAHMQDPDRVARVYLTSRSELLGDRTSAFVGYVLYTAMRDGVRAFDRVATYRPPSNQVLYAGEDAVEIRVASASWDLFPLVGVQPLLGRFFLEEEDRPPEGEPLAILGHGFWETRFGADPAAIGQTIELGPRAYTVVGVAPPGFTGPQFEGVDVWIPISTGPQPTRDWPTTLNASWVHVVVRLAQGVTTERAVTEANAVLRQVYSGDSQVVSDGTLSLAPLHYDSTGHQPLEASVSQWVFVVALILLVIACANVASLQLARWAGREQELAVRLALGIGRGRLLGLVMTQSVLLALAGGAVACLLALWVSPALRQILAPSLAWARSPLDARRFAFTVAITLASGVLTGLLPGVYALRRDLTSAMRRGVRQRGVRRTYFLSALSITQAAAATVLLVGAGLLVKSLSNIRSLPLGIEPDRVLVVGGARLPSDESFYRQAMEQLQSLAEIEAAALAIGVPFQSSLSVSLRVAGRDSIPRMPAGGPYLSAVTSGYFMTVGTRLLRGRGFTPADRADSEPVAIVNETMAGALWPGEDPLNKCLHIGSDDPPCSRVVGVVEDAKRRGLHDEPAMQYFVPLGQERNIGGIVLLVRPRGDATEARPQVRSALRGLAGPPAFFRITTLQEQIDPEIRPWRMGAALASIFGALALGVAAFGLFSVNAFVATQRTHEMGVRLALGARGWLVGSTMLRHGMALALTGLLVGVAVVAALGGFLERSLFEVSPRDPAVFATVAAVVVVVGAMASLLPALRAARVDPVLSLKSD